MRQPMEVGGRPGHLRQTVEFKCCSFPPRGAQGSIHTSSGAASPISSRCQWETLSFLSPLRVMGLLLPLILLLLQRLPSLGFSYRKTLSRTRAPQWLQIYPCLIDIATVSCRAVPQTETEDLSLLKEGGKSKKMVCLIPAEWLWSAVRDPKVPRNLGVKEVDKRIVACDLSPGHCALGPGDDFWHLTGRSLRSSADAMELSEDSVVPRVLAATTLASVLAFYRRSCDPAGRYCLPT